MLRGKNSIITGARRGLGRKTVEIFAENGANIYACARSEDKTFEQDMSNLAEEYGVKIEPVYFEMTDRDQMKLAIHRILGQKENLDILVNNAGIAHGGLFRMTSMKDIRSIFDVNLFATMELTQMILRKMERQQKGCIINVGSISGLDLAAGNCAYGTSKAALTAFTKTLAAEVTPLGIRVNAVAPGLLDTDMANLMEEKAYCEMFDRSLMGRLGSPEEVAECIAFLASDRASFISGEVIRISGGRK